MSKTQLNFKVLDKAVESIRKDVGRFNMKYWILYQTSDQGYEHSQRATSILEYAEECDTTMCLGGFIVAGNLDRLGSLAPFTLVKSKARELLGISFENERLADTLFSVNEWDNYMEGFFFRYPDSKVEKLRGGFDPKSTLADLERVIAAMREDEEIEDISPK